MRAPQRLMSSNSTMNSLPLCRFRRRYRSLPTRRPFRATSPRSFTSRAKRAFGISSHRPRPSARASAVVRTTRVSSVTSNTISTSAGVPAGRSRLASRKKSSVALSSMWRCARSCSSEGKRRRKSAAFALRCSPGIGPPGPNPRASTHPGGIAVQLPACGKLRHHARGLQAADPARFGGPLCTVGVPPAPLQNPRPASTFRRPMPNASAPKDFQGLLLALQTYWAERGCALMQGYDLEVGAGTMNPATFLKVLGPEPWNVAYVEPSRRPADGRFGENPNRLHQHHQYQVILKPSPKEVQDLYLGSLEAIGITSQDHDLRFVEDDWESPTLGAWGLGWEVWCDGMEVTQFTYFQQAGGFECRPVSAELTYRLERIALYLQNGEQLYGMGWTTYADGTKLPYRDVFQQNEREQSEYSFRASDPDRLFRLFNEYEAECRQLIERKLPLPAYDYCLKCSHVFNLLDARGAISVTERQGYILRVRKLAHDCAKLYLATRAGMKFPGLKDSSLAERELSRYADLLKVA